MDVVWYDLNGTPERLRGILTLKNGHSYPKEWSTVPSIHEGKLTVGKEAKGREVGGNQHFFRDVCFIGEIFEMRVALAVLRIFSNILP